MEPTIADYILILASCAMGQRTIELIVNSILQLPSKRQSPGMPSGASGSSKVARFVQAEGNDALAVHPPSIHQPQCRPISATIP